MTCIFLENPALCTIPLNGLCCFPTYHAPRSCCFTFRCKYTLPSPVRQRGFCWVMMSIDQFRLSGDCAAEVRLGKDAVSRRRSHKLFTSQSPTIIPLFEEVYHEPDNPARRHGLNVSFVSSRETNEHLCVLLERSLTCRLSMGQYTPYPLHSRSCKIQLQQTAARRQRMPELRRIA